jgi:hypothetical protein
MRWIKHEAWVDALELVLVAALGVGLAHATWLLIAPRTAGAPTALAQSLQLQPGGLSGRDMFGAPGGESAKRVASATGLVLLGVFAGSEPSAGRAIVGMQGAKPAIASAGEPIADGIELHEVHADHVIVLRQGMPERLELQRGASRPAPTPAPSQAPVRK